ncbi:YezD family protein [Ruficoccus amylovorans]|uniref:YezD family protein n=1 Tax=Ruficoccus amylovorans TaxID=1804625 RepID=A0A842HIK5_9BACT|nr:YezD family protein [Ruficoccus amylovorans]MBC2596232.1 YezD family protein [Ruficoccus amylovorans]
MNRTATSPSDTQSWQHLVIEKVASLRFGVVQIVVHNGKVTQVECTEKTRFDDSADTRRVSR